MSDEVDVLHADKHESLLQIDRDMKLIFCMQINIKVFYKLISTLWASKVSYKVVVALLMGMIKHSQSTSLQDLKKEVRDGVHLCMQINIKVSKNWHFLFLMEVPDMSKLPKIGSW